MPESESSPIQTDVDAEAESAYRIAQILLPEALGVLRTMTPEGWDMAYFKAMKDGMHTVDLGLIKEARLLSMRAGGKWGIHRTPATTS